MVKSNQNPDLPIFWLVMAITYDLISQNGSIWYRKNIMRSSILAYLEREISALQIVGHFLTSHGIFIDLAPNKTK